MTTKLITLIKSLTKKEIKPIIIMDQSNRSYTGNFFVINDTTKEYWNARANSFGDYTDSSAFRESKLAKKLYFAINNEIINERKLNSK